MGKKIFIVFVLIFIWSGLLLSVQINAEDILDERETYISIEDFDIKESSKALKKNGYEDLNIKEMLDEIMNGNILEVMKGCAKTIYEKTIGDISLVEKTLGNLLLIVIISAFFTNFANVFSGESISGTGFYICYLLIITLMITLFDSFCILASDFVKLLLDFMCGIIPAYFISVAITGQVSAAGFYQLTLVIIGVVEFIFINILIPLIKVYVSVSLVNNISKEDFLSKTTDIIKNFVNFINKTIVGIVAGLNIIQALILPAVDGAKNTAVRKVLGALPVVGDSTDAMTGIVLGSVNLIKNTIGGFTIIMIIVFCAVPYLKIQLYSISMQIGAAIVQPIADKRIIGSMGCVQEGIKMLTKVIVGAALLFIISIAIICMVTGKE